MSCCRFIASSIQQDGPSQTLICASHDPGNLQPRQTTVDRSSRLDPASFLFLCVFLVFLLGRFAVFHAPFRCRNGLFEGTHRNLMICLVLVVVLDAISILVFWLHFHRPVNPRRWLVVLVKMAATCRSSRPPPVRMRALAATRYKHENTRPAKAIDIH